MIGAAIEAILLAIAYTLSDEELKNMVPKIKEKFKKELSYDLKKWALDDLIKIAITCEWIPYNGAEDPEEGELGDWLLNYVKEMRNFIHPGKWLNKEFINLKFKREHFEDAYFEYLKLKNIVWGQSQT